MIPKDPIANVRWRSRMVAQKKATAAAALLPRSPKQIAQAKANGKATAGRHPTPEARVNMSAGQTGRKHSAETKAKIGNAQRGRKKPASMIAKITGPKNHRWMGGTSNAPYGWTWNAELKEEVRRRDGYKCQLCGKPQAESEKTFPVHHVNYNKKDSDPINLVTLCHSCHSRTGVHRKHWMAVLETMAIKRSLAELDKR